jgi:hypothetical protein
VCARIRVPCFAVADLPAWVPVLPLQPAIARLRTLPCHQPAPLSSAASPLRSAASLPFWATAAWPPMCPRARR